MSKLQIAFSVEDALKYGLNEAIVLAYLDFWVDKNAVRGINELEGRYYTYISYTRLHERLPFISKRSLQRTIASLVKQKAIILNFRSGAGVQGGRQMMMTTIRGTP